MLSKIGSNNPVFRSKPLNFFLKPRLAVEFFQARALIFIEREYCYMRRAKRIGDDADADSRNLSNEAVSIEKNDAKKPEIYAGSEEKMLNLVVEIIVRIIKKKVL